MNRFASLIPDSPAAVRVTGLTCLLLSLAVPVSAATRHWTGAGANALWSNAANWSNNAAPTGLDVLVFPAGAARLVNTNDLTAGTALRGLRFLGSNYVLRGNAFTLEGSLVFTNANGTNTILAPITLPDEVNSWEVPSSLRTLQVLGPVAGSTRAVIHKTSAGTLVLSNNPAWAGALTLSNGAVVVNGNNAGVQTRVETGFLRGSGVIGAITATNTLGAVDLGARELRVNGDVRLGGNANLQAVLGGVTPGVSHGSLSVTGGVSIAGGNLSVLVTFTPTIGTEFVLVRNDGTDPIVGPGFSARPEGSIFTASNVTFAVSYHGGDGNDLSLIVVPPPSNVTRVWDGGGTGNFWSNRFNWVSDGAPLANDSLEFTDPLATSATNDFPANTVFDSFRFSAVNGFTSFTLRGNAVRLLRGIHSSVNGSALITHPVEFLAPQTIGGEGIGAINLFGPLSSDAGVPITLDRRGVISLGGSFTNALLGATLVRRGTLAIGKADGVRALTGPLVIGGQGSNATVLVQADNQFGANQSVALLDAAAILDFREATGNTVRDVRAKDGFINTALSRLAVDQDFSVTNARLRFSISNNVAGQIAVRGGVSVPGSVLELNVITPLLPVGTGFVLIDNLLPLPVTGRFANVPADGRLTNGLHIFEVNYNTPNGELSGGSVTVELVGYLPTGVTRLWTGASNRLWSVGGNWVGGIAPRPGDSIVFPADLFPALTNDLPAGFVFDTITVQGGPFEPSLGVTGNAVRVLRGIRIGEGASVSLVFPVELLGPMTLHSDGLLAFRDASPSLTFGAFPLHFSGNGHVRIDPGEDSQHGDGLVGTGDIAVDGPLGLFLGGTNRHGRVVMNGGEMRYEGIHHRNSIVSVPIVLENGAKLFSPGTLRGIDARRGTIEVGIVNLQTFTAGILSNLVVNGDVGLSSNTVFQAGLRPTTGRLRVNGTVALGDAKLEVTLLDDFINSRWTIIENNGTNAIAGTFAGLPEGAEFTHEFSRLRVSYVGGDGNDVVLTRLGYTLSGNTRVWTGASPTPFWSSPGNWSGNQAPRPGDTLVFPDNSARRTSSNNLVGLFVGQLILGEGNTLRGNGIQLIGGVLQTNRSAFIELPVDIIETQVWDIRDGDLILKARLGGTNPLVTLNKRGPSALRIDSHDGGDNTFPGPLVVREGAITLLRDDGFAAVRGPVMALEAGSRIDVAQPEQFGGSPPLTALDGAELSFGINDTNHVGRLLVDASTLRLTSDRLEASDNLVLRRGSLLRAHGGTLASSIGVRGTVTLDNVDLEVTVGEPAPAFVTLIENDGVEPVVGTFNGLPQFSRLLAGNRVYEIRYNGGTGNDVTLTNIIVTPTGLTRVWSGASTSSSGAWTDITNWVNDARPARGDSLLFPSGVSVSRQRTTNTFDVTTEFDSLTFANGGYVLAGAPVLLGGDLVASHSGGLSEIHTEINFAAASPRTVISPGARMLVGANGRLRHHFAPLILDVAGVLESHGTIGTDANVLVEKRGPGTLLLRGTLATRDRLLVTGGTVDFAASGGGELIVRVEPQGRLICSGGRAGVITGHGGRLELSSRRTIASRLFMANQATLIVPDLSDVEPLALNFISPFADAVTLDGAVLRVDSLGAAQPGQTFRILTCSLDEQVNGTFNGLPQGAVLAMPNGFNLRINYQGGDGNDVTLTVEFTPIAFTSIARAPNGRVQLTGQAEPNRNVVIEASSDLFIFLPILTTTVTPAGTFTILDNNAPAFPHHFYRARYQ